MSEVNALFTRIARLKTRIAHSFNSLNCRIILVSGRFRSTRKQKEQSQRYRLQYQLSYDGHHIFTEEEKRKMARERDRSDRDELIKDEDEVVVSEYGNDSILFLSTCINQLPSPITLYCSISFT